MHRVRSCIAKGISSFEFVVPMFDPRCFRCHEVLEINGLASRPDALRSAKIRDTAAGGNTGTGEDERFFVIRADNRSKSHVTMRDFSAFRYRQEGLLSEPSHFSGEPLRPGRDSR